MRTIRRISSPTRLRTVALPKALRTANKSFYSFDDPFGSYTGTCENQWDEPVQDVDDL